MRDSPLIQKVHQLLNESCRSPEYFRNHHSEIKHYLDEIKHNENLHIKREYGYYHHIYERVGGK